MRVSQPQTSTAAQKGKKIGTMAGFVGYTANVLKTEGKDVFKSAAENAVSQGLKPRTGIMVKAGAIALIASGFAVAGRIIGGIVGKAVDKYKANKQLNNIIKENLNNDIENAEKIDVDELESMVEEETK